MVCVCVCTYTSNVTDDKHQANDKGTCNVSSNHRITNHDNNRDSGTALTPRVALYLLAHAMGSA